MLKKTVYFALVLAFISSSAFAATQENEGAAAGTTLSVDADIPLNFNFSPSVSGQYVTEDTTANEQWYAIATYHNGGSLFYGSASDQTSVFKKKRTTVQTFEDAAVPTAPVLDEDGNPELWFTPVADGEEPPEDDWYR